MRRLPPLHALRAFEAAARHLSFKAAAAELHVTPAAISHQIKALESELGVKLFRRLTREIRLTEEGHALAPSLRDGFDRLAAAVERVTQSPGRAVLTLSTLTTVAMSWLVPRLPRFQALHPEIDVRVSTAQKIIDFTREEFDGALRHGVGPWPGLARHKLFDDRLTPLASPAIARRLKRPADVAGFPLLDTEPFPEWPIWLAAAGLEKLAVTRGPSFDSTRICLEAAANGIGIALSDPILAADQIASGRLAQPFDICVSTGKAYWFVYPQPFAGRAKIIAFRDWLSAEASAIVTPRASPRGSTGAGRAAAAARRSAREVRGPARGGGSGG
ncbi:MAG: transcriptional regulator GcvA [Alphaproteobacteria bacterium]|nr:transcriptional regulator GcvA [Alphaproteobacteria bacterium]